MSITFTKLFSSITESTVWCEPDRTRLCWITMLAMADQRGRVWASIPGLANRARIPVEDCVKAIQTFLSPDEHSRTKTPECEGRRIEVIDGGWRLVNYAKYRAIRDEESVKESKRKYINNRRAEERKGVDNVDHTISTVEPRRDNAEEEAELEAVNPKSKATPKTKIPSTSRKSVPPDNWQPSDSTAAAMTTEFAIPPGGIERYTQAFLDYCKANSKPYVDFNAAFRNCVRQDWPKFRQNGAMKPKPKTLLQLFDDDHPTPPPPTRVPGEDDDEPPEISLDR